MNFEFCVVGKIDDVLFKRVTDIKDRLLEITTILNVKEKVEKVKREELET